MGIPYRQHPVRRGAPAAKQWTRFLLLALVALVWSGCTRPPGAVIIFGSPDSPRMRQAIAGIQSQLDASPVEVVLVPEFGPQGKETLRRLRQAKPRLLIVLGTPALLLTAPVEKKIPVVFGLVGNPYFTGAAYEPNRPDIHQENITGIASPAPLEAALQHGVSLLGRGAWGLLYDPSDGVAADLARRFERDAAGVGIRPLTETSTTAGDDGPGLERLLARGARVIFLAPAASTARFAPLVLEWGRNMKVRVVSGDPAGSHHGAVLWVVLDYHRLGAEIGELARRVLAGESPKSIPIAADTPIRVEVDEALARKWSAYPPVPSGAHADQGGR
jgi:putative ABC transport system substrate-binding protein